MDPADLLAKAVRGLQDTRLQAWTETRLRETVEGFPLILEKVPISAEESRWKERGFNA